MIDECSDTASDITETFPAGAFWEGMMPVEPSNSPPRLIRLNNSAAFPAILNKTSGFPCFNKVHFTRAGRKYYRAVEAETHVDDTFAILRDDFPLLVVECNANNGVLGRFGGPIELRFSAGATSADIHDCATLAFAELSRIALERGVSTIVIRTSHSLDPFGIIISYFVSKGAIPKTEFRTVVDLSLSEDEIRRELRPSYRRHVSWGEKNISLHVMTSACPDRELFEKYRSFHADISGRVTRGAESWDAMFSWITCGVGELIIGTQNDQLIAGAIFMDAMDTCNYASGVFDRARFKHPISHFIMLSAILRAKRRGLRWFDVGIVHAANENVTEKERNIGHFKHGFSHQMMNSVIWTTPLTPA